MGYSKSYKGLESLPEVKELIEAFLKRGYMNCHCYDSGLRMQKMFTEIHFIPETDRLRLCIHDDGMGEKETDIALEIGKKIVEKYGYKQGNHSLNEEEWEHEYYKYF